MLEQRYPDEVQVHLGLLKLLQGKGVQVPPAVAACAKYDSGLTAIYKVTVDELARVPLAQALSELLGRPLSTQARWLLDGDEACRIAAVATPPTRRRVRGTRAQR